MSDKRILIVEDDLYGREVAARMVAYHLIEVDTAPNAEEALKLLAANVYSLVVIDLNLPAMDGWALLRTIRGMAELNCVPCIAITAYHDAKVALEALRAGFAAYIPKPLQNTFVPQLQAILSGHGKQIT